MFLWLIFYALPFFAWLATWPFFVKKAVQSRALRIAVWLALGVCFAKFAAFRAFGGSAFLPLLPGAVVRIWSIAYSFAMLLAAFSMLFASLERLAKILRPHLKSERATAAIAAAGALAATASGHGEAWRIPRTVKRELSLSLLPPAFDGLRIVHLSDLHISSAAPRRRTEKIVEIVNSLDADVVAITGDIVDAPVDEIEGDVAPLAGLKAKFGVFGCTGNHEFYVGYDVWREVFAKCGIAMLENSHRILERGDAHIAIGGIMDPQGMAMRNPYGEAFSGPDARLAFASAPADAFKILLAHRPVRLAKHAREGVRLQLSGHTHGGAMPGLATIIANANEGHVRGFYAEHGVLLFVHPGSGQWAGFPMRICNPQEITLLVLRAG
ncbi:MAG: metallophosphoesterase [Kiritimatiellae bacterium]|nr:metallophosphoesterase [Kiritimatiellia bacterium]